MYIKSTSIKSVISTSKAKATIVRAKPATTCTAGIKKQFPLDQVHHVASVMSLGQKKLDTAQMAKPKAPAKLLPLVKKWQWL